MLYRDFAPHICSRTGLKYQALRKFASVVHSGMNDELDGTPPAKKSRPDSEHKCNLLENIINTEDFIDFLCFGANEKFLSNLSQNLKKNKKLTKTSSTKSSKSSTETKIKRKSLIEKLTTSIENHETTKPHKDKRSNIAKKPDRDSNPHNNHPRKRPHSKSKSQDKSKHPPTTPNKSHAVKLDPHSPHHLKNRLRASTKALTAATTKDHLLMIQRRLSQELSPQKLAPMAGKSDGAQGNVACIDDDGCGNAVPIYSGGCNGGYSSGEKLFSSCVVLNENIMKDLTSSTGLEKVELPQLPPCQPQLLQTTTTIQPPLPPPTTFAQPHTTTQQHTSAYFQDIAVIEATTKDFNGISNFINKLSSSSSTYPAVLIRPPTTFKVDCNAPQQIRCTTHNQYVHRFFNRWGGNSVKLASIITHLDSQGTNFSSHPLIGGIEVDLVGLLDSINNRGGLQKVIDDVTWNDVINDINVPKVARDKVSRFYEVYCRYLLSYDTLSHKEKSKLERKVLLSRNSSDCDDLCVSKGRCRTLSELYVTARNVATMFNLEDATNEKIMTTYWNIVREASMHLTVHTAYIKSSDVLCARRRSGGSRYRMGLMNLMKCCDDHMCPVCIDEDLIDSRLEVEMMFSSRCWSRDIHGRGSLVYNHTGADVIWYFVRGDDEEKMKRVMMDLVPDLVHGDKSCWLTPNAVMIPPSLLTAQNITVYRCTLQPGHLLLIPPSTFHSSVSSGYSITEHAHFLTYDWLSLAAEANVNLNESCMEAMVSLEKILFLLLSREYHYQQHPQQQQQQHQQQHQQHHHQPQQQQQHHHQQQQQPQSQQHHQPQHQAQHQQQHQPQHLSLQQLQQALNIFEAFVCKEMRLRRSLMDLGVKRRMERMAGGMEAVGSDEWMDRINSFELSICNITKGFCFFSKVIDRHSNEILCLECTGKKLLKKKAFNHLELLMFFNQSELNDFIIKIRRTFNIAKTPNKQSKLTSA